ncbi:MAG: putative LmbE-like protein [Bacteriovoracaceae bacterium]|nr:putative LmbE-like protein [Bacteriovoracaceae bacterium]
MLSSYRDRLFHGRTIIFGAHPDDEIIGIGGHLDLFEEIILVHATNGSPSNLVDAHAKGFDSKEAYASARKQESRNALAVVGKKVLKYFQFELDDQKASFDLTSLTEQLINLIRHLKPSSILTHPYEGGHPDHDAAAFTAQCAVHLLRCTADFEFEVPGRFEFTSYHSEGGQLKTNAFLPHPTSPYISILPLSSERFKMREKMLDCFVSQQETLKPFRTIWNEKIRTAPTYDFTLPPRSGARLYYEDFNWGISGSKWRVLAKSALEKLYSRVAA